MRFQDASIAANTFDLVSTFSPLPGFSHETLVRVVGSWAAGGGPGNLVMGMCVATDSAIAVGATALPNPVDEISDDIWVFIDSISFSVALSGIGEQREHHFDGRAMRKVDEGSSLILVVANNSGAAASFAGYLRVLAKLAVRG